MTPLRAAEQHLYNLQQTLELFEEIVEEHGVGEEQCKALEEEIERTENEIERLTNGKG